MNKIKTNLSINIEENEAKKEPHIMNFIENLTHEEVKNKAIEISKKFENVSNSQIKFISNLLNFNPDSSHNLRAFETSGLSNESGSIHLPYKSFIYTLEDKTKICKLFNYRCSSYSDFF